MNLSRPLAALLLAAGLAAPSQAQTICRTNGLDGTNCLPDAAPRPMPRGLQSDVQALERILRQKPANAGAPEFTPAWRTNSFGDTLMPGGTGRAGPGCRRDSFGNLRCP